MKIRVFTYWLTGLVMITAGCNINKEDHGSDEPQPDKMVRLNLTCEDVDGSENLRFRWEKVDFESEDISKLALFISDGETALPAMDSDGTSSAHTCLTVSPHEDNASYAGLQTAGCYSEKDLESAKYCYSIYGAESISDDSSKGTFRMPSTFTQSASQGQAFLKDYMHMYATAEFHREGTHLQFRHIPAVVSLVINNNRSDTVTLQSTSMHLTDATSENGGFIASSSSAVTFDWSDGGACITYGEKGYESVVTVLEGQGRALIPEESHTVYAMVLPLADNDAFKDKVLTFTLKADNSEEIVIQMSGDDFANNNGGIYNWTGGKEYTFTIIIDSDDKAKGEILEGNRILVTSDDPATYSLKYEGADGKPLENYYEICTLTIDETAYYEDFIDVNIAPREAERIGIYDMEMNRHGCISIKGFKPDYSEPLYTIGMLSDVHVVPDNKVNCIDNFQRALTFFNENNVDFTCICGDISEKGTAEEYSVYKQVVETYSDPSAPVYTTTGNHDCQSSGINLEDWKEYTGQDLVFEHSVTLPDGSIDHFLFLGMSYWSSTRAYLDSDITWLENKLAEYADERCFVITHMFFPDRAGNMREIYPPGNWMSGPQLERLRNICDSHINSIWFSGHSHWKWYLQKYEDKANVFRAYNGGQPASGWCVHIPSCSKPQDSNGLPRGEQGSRVEKSDESEGALIHVYEDHIDILGLDLKNLKYLPIASYRLSSL